MTSQIYFVSLPVCHFESQYHMSKSYSIIWAEKLSKTVSYGSRLFWVVLFTSGPLTQFHTLKEEKVPSNILGVMLG